MGRIFVVHSAKGGVGKSLLAVNLAAAIGAETRRPVLVLDFALPLCRDVAFYLNLAKIRSLDKLLPMAESIQSELLRSYPVQARHNLWALSLLQDENDLLDMGEEFFRRIILLLERLAAIYDCMIIDLDMQYSRFVEQLLDLADRIILPLAADPLALLGMVEELKLLKMRNFPKDTLQVVLNHTTPSKAINEALARQRLERPLSGVIPHEPEMTAFFSEGRLFALDRPEHPITKALERLTLLLLQARPTSKEQATSPQQDPDHIDPETKTAIKVKIHSELLEILDLKKLDTAMDNDPVKLQELQSTVRHKTIEILDRQTDLTSRKMRDEIVREVLQEALGLGALEDLLEDPSISEIMVTSWNKIYVERSGKLQLISRKFLSEAQLLGIIERIVAPLGRRIDSSSPMVDARLKDGSRVNAVIAPLAVTGANLTIRKFGKDTVGMNELIQFGSLNSQIAEFLKAAVLCRLNIIVSGGTGTGKTTLLNILSSFIPEDERIVTIEDSAELQLRQPHVITLESRPPNIEGSGEITIRDLVKNSLRMRPDRIVVGECRAGEALDMLQAMNTGHDGSLTTLHANSARESLARLETLVMFAGFELPIKAIRSQITGAIDIIVQLTRFKDGSRKIVQVSEVTGMEGEMITMGDIYVFRPESSSINGKVQGNFVSTGYTPQCLTAFHELGIQIPKELFWTTT